VLNHPTNTSLGRWRLLVLDADAADPKWLLCTVAEPADVRPAGPADTAPDDLTRAWVSARHGQPGVTLTALPRARAWRIDESPAPES
jgi:hypothetical protein